MLRVVILSLAITAGAFAGWMALTLAGGPGAPAEANAAPALAGREVLVAAAPIRRGDELGPDNLTWRFWPDSAMSEGLVLREDAPDATETYEGWISRTDLLDGEPLRTSRMAEGTAGLMSLMLTPGMRATAVRTSAESSAGGFILPNDRVDVVYTLTADVDGDGRDEPVSKTIIHNARVLAVDQIAEHTEGEPAKVAETVTLELTPQQVELLTTARNSGRISLSLRAVADFGDTELGDLALLAPKVDHEAPEHLPPADPPAPASSATAVPQIVPDIARVRIIASGQVRTIRLDEDH